jgi:hypothetical protein
MWGRPYTMELDEAQTSDKTPDGPEAYPPGIDTTSGLSSLATPTTGGDPVDPGPLRPLSPANTPPSRSYTTLIS